MNLKKLKLGRNLIVPTINNYLGKKIEPTKRTNNGININRYTIDANSMLDIYYNLDTTTTLSPIGGNPDMAELIAVEIVEQCSMSVPTPCPPSSTE